MNKQTRSLRKEHKSTSVIKGAPVPKEGKSVIGESLIFVEFENTKGRNVDSSKGRLAGVTPNGHARKAWRGLGNPLGR